MARVRQLRQPIPPIRAFLFGLVVATSLIFVLFPWGSGDDVGGIVLMALATGGAFALYLHLFQPREMFTLWRLLMVALLFILWVLAVRMFFSLTLPDDDRLFLSYMLPLASAPMLVATLLNGGLAMAMAALITVFAVFAGLQADGTTVSATADGSETLQMVSVFLLSSFGGVLVVHQAERLNRYLIAGAVVALTSFVVLLAFWFIDAGREGRDILFFLLAASVNGLLSAVATLGATVVLGLLFGITTRLQLMELSQLSHPLLRRLQQEAPGTFHHSVIVGNLAEAAAHSVSADPLLTRVGCYFHDIGKISQPEYYIENQQGGENLHDKMTPQASAAVISQHVRSGVELARRHRLPRQVKAFIPEHHGTRLITYFYRKASAQDADVDPDKFRYPGPRPRSKETAMVMLADSVEAVVRSSKDRSQGHIDSIVDGVINERLAEGQLDECDLTIRDLKAVAESFKASLRGIYHPRIEYPAPTTAEQASQGVGNIGTPPGPVDGTVPPPEVEQRSS